LLAPKAGEVLLNGNWDNGRNIKMTKDDQGIWSVTVDPLGDQLWGYSFSLDGVKVLDPGNGEYQRDGARYDNLLMISGQDRTFGISSRRSRTAPCRRSAIHPRS